jgi:hypothetical protein
MVILLRIFKRNIAQQNMIASHFEQMRLLIIFTRTACFSIIYGAFDLCDVWDPLPSRNVTREYKTV